MAQDWCLAYGILPFERANKLNMIVCKRKGKPVASIASPAGKVGSKTSKPAAKTTNTTSKRKKVQNDDDVVGDTGMGASSSWEGIGASGL